MACAEPTCETVSEQLTEFLEDALGPDELTHITCHLARCDDCLAELQQLVQTIEFTAQFGGSYLPRERATSMIELFQGWKARRQL